MKQIYLHGLGQSADDWNETIAEMDSTNGCECVNLVELLRGKDATYANLYASFVSDCHKNAEPVILCGLSLGSVLAMNYALDYPEKVKALVLIAPQYKMPKRLLQLQNTLFHVIPKAMFQTMGFQKTDFIQLCKTMSELDFSQSLSRITCPVLVICGEKDSANKRAAISMAGRLKNAELRVITHAGHEVNKDTPAALAAEMNLFFHRAF